MRPQIVLGRKDADVPDAEGRVLKGDASAEEVKVPAPSRPPVTFENAGASCSSESHQSRISSRCLCTAASNRGAGHGDAEATLAGGAGVV